jgi:hypothetical protein
VKADIVRSTAQSNTKYNTNLPSISRRAAHDLEHPVDLVDVIAAGEKRKQGKQLCNNSTS